MLSIQSLKAFVEVICSLDIHSNLPGDRVCTADWRSNFDEEKQVELLQLIFSLTEKKGEQTGGSKTGKIVKQFVYLLESCKISLPEVMKIRVTEQGQTGPAILTRRDHMWSKFRSLLCSTLEDICLSLCKNQIELSSDFNQWQIVASMRWSASVMGSQDQVAKTYKLSRKSHFRQEIISGQKEPTRSHELSLSLEEYNDHASWAISSLKFDSRVLSAVIRTPKRALDDMATIYLDILGQQLETTLLVIRNANQPWEATNNSSRLSTGSSRTRTDSSSHRGYRSDVKDADPSLVSEDIAQHTSDTLNRSSVELLLLIARSCVRVEEEFQCQLDLLDPCCFHTKKEDKCDQAVSDSRLRWRWRSYFLPFVGDLIPAMNLAICFDCSVAMDEEWERMRSEGTFSSLASPTNLLLGSVALLCSSLKRFSLLLHPDDKCLGPVRTAFSLCARQQCSEVVNHALKLSRHVSSQALPIAPAYVVLNSLLHLQGCVRKLVIQESELWAEADHLDVIAKVLKDQIFTFHVTVFSTCILHDAESNDWSNEKPFFENERCSLHVQAWYNHLSALKHDLWQLAGDGRSESPLLIRNLFGDVLENSLEILAARYCSVSPSSARINHLQSDVVAILTCVSELLLPASKDVSTYLGMDKDDARQAKIHGHCSALLTAMVVIASPLKKLYKQLKKEHPDRDSNDLAWLSLIRPSIWRSSAQSNPSPASRMLMHLKIFLEQPVTNYGALLEALMAKDTVLAKLIVAHPEVAAFYDSQIVRATTEPWDNHQFRMASPVIDSSFDCPQQMLSCAPSGGDCLMSVLYVLAHTSNAPECFAEVFLHIFGRDLCAYEFDEQVETPLWLRILVQVLEPLLVCLGQSFIVPLLIHMESNDAGLTELFTLANEVLPTPVPNVGSYNLCRSISIALLEMLNAIPLMLYKVPLPVCVMLASVSEGQMGNVKCWPFQVIVTAVNKFLDVAIPESSSINDNTFELINQSLVYLSNPTSTTENHSSELRRSLSGMDSHVARVADTVVNFCVSCKKNLTTSAQTLSDCDGGASSATADLSPLMSSERGLSSLQIVHWFLSNHLQWLENRLCINDEPSMRLPEREKNRLMSHSSYNPFLNLFTIGNSGLSFQQSSLVRVVNWDSLLEENLPTNKLAFSNLLRHRWEFQESARLDETQKKYVNVLRQKYCSESNI